LSEHRVHPETLAGDPFAAEHKRVRQSCRTEEELVAAIREDEARQGHPMIPREREAFARGFFGQEYGEEIRMLARAGLLDGEDGEE
jgi:hypothetical protein